MKKFTALLLAFLLAAMPLAAQVQGVGINRSGSYTVGNIVQWASGGRLSDSGTAATGVLSSALATNHVFIGSAGGIATDKAMSGDGSILASGALTISSIGGKAVSLANSFTMSGNFTFTGTLTGTTAITYPTTGTLATLAGSEAFTNKTYNGNTFTAGTGVLTIAAAKMLTASNTLTLTGTDGSSVAFGTGGTAVMQGGALGTPLSGTLTSATGLPISTGVSGLGTGVAAALAINTGSAGAFVTFNGAGGTPSSIVLTNATGTAASLTAGTASAVAVGGITGLGTGVATLLGGASSGTGGPAGTASPTFTGTPVLNTASASSVNVTGSTPPANGEYLVTTNTWAVSTNSAERMRIDANGIPKFGGGCKYNTADVSVSNNSSTYTSLTDLTFSVTNGNTYGFVFNLQVTNGASGGLKTDLNGGSATVSGINANGVFTGAGGGIAQAAPITNLTGNEIGITAQAGVAQITGGFTASSTGTFIPRFTQNASNATATTVNKYSWGCIYQVN